MRLTRAVVSGVIMLLLGSAAPASAEWFGDVYAGLAETGSRDLTIENDPSSPVRNVEFDKSTVFGGRVGYWFEDFEYIALALDALHYRPNIGAQTANSAVGPIRLGSVDLDVTALSAQLLLRYPLLRAERFPHGRLQPYFLVGPIVAIAHADDTTNFGPPPGQSHGSVRAGFNVGTGVMWHLAKHVGVFGEYRYLQFTPVFGFEGSGNVQFNVNSHLFMGGLSVRF